MNNDFELGSVDHLVFIWQIRQWFNDYKKDLEKKKNDFIQEIIDEDHKWVKECRLEYLENKRKEYREEVLPFVNFINRHQSTYSFLTDVVKELYSFPLLKKIKKVETEIDGWNEPGYDSFRLTGEDIERARSELCTNYLDIKRKDYNRSWALCLWHEDHTPSLCIYEDTNQYHCFVCGAHGDVIDLVMKLYGKKFPDAIKFILKR